VLRISKKLLFLLALLPWTAYATELASLEPQADIQQYRCEIITQYAYLYKISSDYGNILVNEDEVNIFHASKSAVESFDEVLGELKAMDVPVRMGESHQILIKSVHSYTQSASNMQKAIGIFIGEYDGNEHDSLELIDESEKQVILGNKHLAKSLDMYDNSFVLDDGSF
jgi:short-subunit dehydrogenase